MDGSNSNGDPQRGGSVIFRVDFTMNSYDESRRRLSEVGSSFDMAVVESVQVLIGPSLPKDSSVACTSAVEGSKISANVTVKVTTQVMSTQTRVTEFLSNDLSDKNVLPGEVSERTGIALGYADGYVPIVWSDLDVSVQVVIILPYVLAGVGVVALVLVIVLYKYRFVIKSFLSEMVSKLIPSKSRWGTSTFGNHFRTVTSLLTRGKSEISSTPDTATNVDQDEFDDYILRNSA